MNKAFVREADDGPTRCPSCGSPGIAVQEPTVARHVPDWARGQLSGATWFCRSASCPVVYFDAFGGAVTREVFEAPIADKDLDAPLCSCFGLTRADIEADIAENSVSRTKSAVLRAQSPEARCQTCAPSGQSCLAAVQGYYLKLRNPS